MKKSILVLGMFFMMTVHAAETKKYKHPSPAEISASRACFSDLEVQGCGKPDDDYELFRSCLSQVQDSLDDDCRKTVTQLYGDK